MRQVMEKSLHTHNEHQWEGLQETLAPSVAADVTFPELDAYVKEEAMEGARPEAAMEEPTGWNPTLVGQSWTWMEIVPCMPEVDPGKWSPSPSRQEVVHIAACTSRRRTGASSLAGGAIPKRSRRHPRRRQWP